MKIVTTLKKKAAKLRRPSGPAVHQILERQILLQAQMLRRQNNQLQTLTDLSEVEFSAFSQWGEDGIIDWLVHKLEEVPCTFIEFGVENYHEANTRHLLLAHNWCGLVMDGSASKIQDIMRQNVYWRHNLTAKCAFINRDNINTLIEDGGLTGEVGLLSVDIDGVDYWVWKAIEVVNPAIVVTEYNAVFGDLHELTVPYRVDFERSKAHFSNLYFGASLPALISLGEEKGYTFVGTTSSGVNAFFLRKDLAGRVTPFLSEAAAFPSQVREARGKDGRLLFLGGGERSKIINNLPLLNLYTGEQTSLREMGRLYSDDWLMGKKAVIAC